MPVEILISLALKEGIPTLLMFARWLASKGEITTEQLERIEAEAAASDAATDARRAEIEARGGR